MRGDGFRYEVVIDLLSWRASLAETGSGVRIQVSLEHQFEF